MQKRTIICLGFLLLTGCGQNVVPGVAKKSEGTKVACPAVQRSPEEQITVFLGEPLPSRIAIEVNGERKVSECGKLRSAPPFVRMLRLPGNRISLKVQRLDSKRAEEISFVVKDLKNCSGEEAELLTEEHSPLRYSTEFPDGRSCASQEVARKEIVR